MSEQVQKITHVEHILKRPDSYVGPTAKVEENYYVLGGDKFVSRKVSYAPALLKIFDEILVNAIDRNSMFPKDVKTIKVSIDKESGEITVENNGPLGGISVNKHEKEQLWNPELTFGHLLTSTNYDDTKKRTVGGRNGYGSKLTNIYSSRFRIIINDPENGIKYRQQWTENMTVCNPPKMAKSVAKQSSVSISFIPDWKRFGMTGMDDDFVKIVEKRLYDAAVCTSTGCSVWYQGTKLPNMSLEMYAKKHLDDDIKTHSVVTDRWAVTVAPSDNGFQQVSFVNGICTTKGGTHVDYIAGLIASGIIDDMAKKIKLKPQQVKNTFFVFVKSTLENPSFSSQVKSECTLKYQEFGSRFDHPKQFIKSVLKTGIQDEVLSLSKFKEQKELKKSDGVRRNKITGIPKLDDANFAGTNKSYKCTLIVTEGDSAKTLAVAGLSIVGRDTYGVFPLRGKCKNVRDASVKQLMANQEFNDLKKILGLQQDKVYKSLDELRYGRLMIMTDADNDGSHIKGLIINMIHAFWPSLLDLGFVVSMITPIIKATKGAKTFQFYTDSAFREWWDTASKTKGWKIKYYKGLGTSTSVEAREYFKDITRLTVKFEPDTTMDDSIKLAFDKTKADDRKEWLLVNTEKEGSELEVPYGKITNLGVTDFIHKDLVNFSLADLKRSIASMCDGLKPSQRKVMYACFNKNLKDEMKVAQLAAYVSEKTSYHHGETSLADTIVKLAHTYMGSNNANLLEPCGQFGTRLMGGKDASQPRYIFTKLSDSARTYFHPHDDAVLNYLSDDGKQIEPEYYVPVIPMVLVNGTEGIGTGFSCSIPSFNPKDIKTNIMNALANKTMKTMTPWFDGFKGKIVAETSQKWIATGIYQDVGKTKRITELPPGRWTQDYKEYLDILVEKKVISNYKNNSTTEDVDFTIYDYNGKDFVKDMKLQKSITATNMHLFHPDKGIVKYDTAEDIIKDFIEIRKKYYDLRKTHLIKELERTVTVLQNKAKFVKMVVDEELVIFKKKRSVFEAELSKLFPKIDDSYDYLLNIKTWQYTEESIEAMTKEAGSKNNELKTLNNTSMLEMWKKDMVSN